VRGIVPEVDEHDKFLQLSNLQERSVQDVLRAFEHGAVVGTGTAKGVLLGDTMGAGKTVIAIAATNAVSEFRRILVICMASAIEKVWVEHIRRWQIGHLRITPVHAVNNYDIGAIPRGWVIINYALLAKHHDGLRAKEWDLIIIDEGQALKTSTAVRTINVFGGVLGEAGVYRGTPKRQYRRIGSLAGQATRVLILTGTPIKNRPEELFPLANFLAS
jgi:SWI/SNF-related matrix-associated actin-dependent regulator of chromatin subfamily A-like protein 1